MSFEHDNTKPECIQGWEGQYTILPWLADVTAIPHVIFMVTTLKENGLPNASLQGWSCFTGEGDHYYVIMSSLGIGAHTYQNIKRTGEFCVNFLPAACIDQCKESIRLNQDDTDEITASGFTPEPSHTIAAPRIQESFLKLECQYEWEKELTPGSIGRMVCGKVRHISISDEFARSAVADRYGRDSFMFHLTGMKDPYTGQGLGGGIGHIELTREMDL